MDFWKNIFVLIKNNFNNLYKKNIKSLEEIEKTYNNDSKISSELYILKKNINIKINKIDNLNINDS